MKDLIKVEDVSFNYPSKKNALKNVNITIKQGTFTCIVGENGSGKSTLLKCILGLSKGYTGKIVKEDKIGYLPQKTEVQTNFPASIEEVVMSGTISRHINSIFYKKDDKERAKEIMEQLDIYKIRKKSFTDLSGGQQQRVLIARAMCATEKIIVLDEPTNGLDSNIALQIYKMLDELKRTNNLTILMVSHDIDRALKYADKVIKMENGEIKFNSSTTEFIKAGGMK